MKSNFTRSALGLFLGMSIFFLFSLTAFAAPPLIYVSGNPDCYPVEFFNEDTEQYEGYIPGVLSQFAQEYGYEIRYLDAGNGDGRISHHKNAQAELISACTKADAFSAQAYNNGVVVFKAEVDYKLLFTAVTNESLKTDLTDYIAKITAAQSNTILVGAVAKGKPGVSKAALAIAVSVAALCLAVGVVLAVLLKKKTGKAKNKDTDILTGVGNYIYLERYFKQFITDKNRSLYSAVFFGAYLKNEHEDFHALLKYMAVMLNDEMGDTDILARVDDGFVVLKSLSEQNEVSDWVNTIVEKIGEGIEGNGEFGSAVVTGGIYTLDIYDRDLDKIIANAAYCSRYAFKNEKAYAVYSKKIEKAEKEDRQLREDLHAAFLRDEFTVYLQFFVHSGNRAILGAEALARWNHPTLGVLSPSRFVDLLEQEKKIQDLDFTVMRKACECLQEICVDTKKAFFISCNFSRNTFVIPHFVETVKSIVQEYKFPKECLLLEVTEYSKIADNEILFNNIKGVQELGIKVVIDDFGNGFSDLLDIGKARFDGVKLDKTLVDGRHTEADDIILKSLVDLMHKLGMTVIAEGVEHEEQSARLFQAGCCVIQGYYYYLPMPRLEALRVLLDELKRIK